jgi:hypothetical protein
MKSLRTVIQLFALVLVCTLLASAQTPGADVKHFNKDGLAFDYPTGWTLEDTSNSDAQQIVLARADSDAQIRFYIHRNSIKPENLEKARHSLVDPYIEKTSNTFVNMGAKPVRSTVATEIGGPKADGVKISAVLDGDPGAAEIYWALVGQRMVVLTFFGPDRAMKKASAAWDTVRNSLTIEGATPQPKASPKTTP